MDRTRYYTAVPSAGLEAELDQALEGIAAQIDSLKLPFLRAVILGGGYGRGEGGVHHTPQGDRLYNDLDFFVFSSGAGRSARRRIDEGLKGVSSCWEKKLGIAVDFCPAREPETLRKSEGTLMYQELLRGWIPVWGKIDLSQWIRPLEPEEIPFTEAVRLLLNRGMGLVFAGEYLLAGSTDADFIVRNMNKALLGSGDALLIADGLYRWNGAERKEAFFSYVREKHLPEEDARLYEKAFCYKREPVPVMPEDPAGTWRTCREFFLDSVRRAAGVRPDASPGETASALSRRAAKYRSFRNLLRWARRTGSVRAISTMRDEPVVTALGLLYGLLASSAEPAPCPAGLRRLWTAFN